MEVHYRKLTKIIIYTLTPHSSISVPSPCMIQTDKRRNHARYLDNVPEELVDITVHIQHALPFVPDTHALALNHQVRVLSTYTHARRRQKRNAETPHRTKINKENSGEGQNTTEGSRRTPRLCPSMVLALPAAACSHTASTDPTVYRKCFRK